MAIESPATKAAAIREKLDHPIIDTDGHSVEFTPAYVDYLRDVAGNDLAERFGARWSRMGLGRGSWASASWEQRRHTRWMRPAWWGLPAGNTRDRVTATLPKLLHERLDELGFDYTIMYPTDGLFLMAQQDDELRQSTCRALNKFYADHWLEYSGRMTPAAVIPLHTPEEGIAELEHAVSLGLKVMLIPSYVERPIPAFAALPPQLRREATYLDGFGLDSAHDYDPFWAKCLELGVAVAAHSAAMGFSDRRSISNYMLTLRN